MYHFLLSLHSLVRWLVLLSLLFALYTAYRGILRKRAFSPFANSVRHWTATAAHIQLMIGITIYFQSPVVKYAVAGEGAAMINGGTFFRYLHSLGMIAAIVLVTIGSAKAKRMTSDLEKYRTMFTWFFAALIVILLAIPWPVYEAVSRPLLRTF